MKPIYLDHNATTPVDPEVCDAMLPYLRECWGNPSSSHELGRAAREGVERARGEVASLIGARPLEIVFTSSGTEATHLSLIGAAEALRPQAREGRISIVSFTLEHPAVLVPLEELKVRGDRIALVPPDSNSVVRIDALREAMLAAAPPEIVSLMHAHNETGAIQPVEEVGRIARGRGILFHVDAAQTIGKIAVSVSSIGCDLLSIAAHKLYGPKGAGALYIREGTPIRPVVRGAGQERGMRGGTENVAGIVGLGAACRIAGQHLAAGESARLTGLRERLWDALKAAVPGIRRTAEGVPTLPNTLHVRFPGIRGNALLARVPEIAASTGSACHAGSDEPPAAIVAIGASKEDALGSIRLSLGRGTDAESIDLAARLLAEGWRGVLGGNADGPGR